MTETTQTLSLGQQLKTAREALNLSLDDVVQKTNLKKNHLESLEDDIFILPNVPPAFMRGYVRSYVRFLRLPEELIGSVNYGEVTIPKDVKRVAAAAPIPVKNNQKSQTRWVKGLTWLVLLGAIGMTLAWWWQEHKKEQANSEQLVSNAVEVAPQGNSDANAVPVVIPAAQEPSVQVQPMETAKTEVVAEPVVQPEVVKSEPVEQVKIEPTPVQPLVVEQPKVEVVEAAQPETAQQILAEQAKVEEPKAEEQSQAVGNDELRIEITNAQSWITVRGAKNKKLAEKLYNSGEVLTFNGNEQYRLTVGAPANVKIYYKGQQVPLKVDGRVARFKLPLAN